MISLSYGLSFASILFVLGILGVLIRCNLFFILLSVEIIINAIALAFVLIGEYFHDANGQVMYVFIITVAAIESGICLTLLLCLYRQYRILDINKISEKRG